jgi:hypothetical protein
MPIRRGQFGSFDGPLENAELMAESQDLELQRRSAPELAVTIKDNVAVSARKRQCLSKLLQNPIARRMRGGVK